MYIARRSSYVTMKLYKTCMNYSAYVSWTVRNCTNPALLLFVIGHSL